MRKNYYKLRGFSVADNFRVLRAMARGGSKRKAEDSKDNSNPKSAKTEKTKRRTRSSKVSKKKGEKKSKEKTSNGGDNSSQVSRDNDRADEFPADNNVEMEDFDEDGGQFEVDAAEDREFNSSIDESNTNSQTNSGTPQSSQADSSSDEESKIDQLVEEAVSDSEEDREVSVATPAKTATPKKKASTTGTKQKGVEVVSPVASTSRVDETQKKQLQDITEFFREKDAISKAWDFINEIKKGNVPRPTSSLNTAPGSERSANSNSNAEVVPETRTQIESKQRGGVIEERRKKLPAVEEVTRGNRQGIDTSVLYKNPNLSRSEVTLYSIPSGDKTKGSLSDEGETVDEMTLNDSDTGDTDTSGTSNSLNATVTGLSSGEEESVLILNRSVEFSGPPLHGGARQGPPVGEHKGESSRAREKTYDEQRRSVKRQTDQRIVQAERTRTDAIKPEGRVLDLLKSLGGEFEKLAVDIQTIRCDNEFDPMAAEIDDQTYQAIQQGKYVDLKRLLPKDNLFAEEESTKYHITDGEDGTPRFVKSKGESDRNGINSIKKWLVAFNVYATAYSKSNPLRASEIFQYILDIQDAAQTYTWESVYVYDRVIRRLMERNSTRKWNTPYTKYWNKLLKVKPGMSSSSGHGGGKREGGRPKKEICWKFNKGKCTRGDSCYRDHRCNFCGKFGHGEHVCRLKRDKKDKDKDNKESKDTRA